MVLSIENLKIKNKCFGDGSFLVTCHRLTVICYMDERIMLRNKK